MPRKQDMVFGVVGKGITEVRSIEVDDEQEETSRPNHNCLYGMQCPTCHSYKPFILEVRTQVLMWDEGSDPYGAGGDQHWDDTSYCRCEVCDHEGTVRDFRQTPPERP